MAHARHSCDGPCTENLPLSHGMQSAVAVLCAVPAGQLSIADETTRHDSSTSLFTVNRSSELELEEDIDTLEEELFGREGQVLPH